MSLFTDMIAAAENVLDKRSEYGDGLADVAYSVDTTLAAPAIVYARKIFIAEGVVLASIGPMILYARDGLENHGIIRPQRPGTVALGTLGGVGTDADPDSAHGGPSFDIAPGQGGAGGENVYIQGGAPHVAFDPADFAIHTPFQFFSYLANLPAGVGGMRGGSGGSGGSALSGTGGLGGGFLAIVTPTLDNEDGAIDLSGQDGAPAADAADPDGWTVATAYGVGDLVTPSTPNGHAYLCLVAGTSHASTEPTWPTDNSNVNDNGITWRDIGNELDLAGGGGGGQGGIFAFFGRDHQGNQPDLAGGEGGAYFGMVQPNPIAGAGAPGIQIVVKDR